jgi:predicted XRE-type DNA-binding protein
MTAYDANTGETFVDVFDAIEPDKIKAADMRLRANIMIDVTEKIKTLNLTKKELAMKLEISQTRLNALLNDKIQHFSLGSLLDLASRAGIEYTIDVKKAA